MIASLPMYDLPEIRWATDEFGIGILSHFKRQGIRSVPDRLIHDIPVNQLWSDKRMIFSQCCGYDVVYGYKNRLRVIATPRFKSPECRGHDYVSFIIVHTDSQYADISEMQGTIAVINGCQSQSGMNAMMSLASEYYAGDDFFSNILTSGSHRNSLSYIKNKLADVASIDSMTYTLLERHCPDCVADTRVLGTTYPAPAPPYVTCLQTSDHTVDKMKSALLNAFEDPKLVSARKTLLLQGISISTDTEYQRIRQEFKHSFHEKL